VSAWRGSWLLPASTLACAVAAASGARAEEPPQITVRASADHVEAGEPFTIELKALVDNGNAAPQDPELRTPAGVDAQGPSISTQTIINGFGARAQVRVGLGATWSLSARAPGTYTIPSPTVQWKGRRYGGSPIKIQVAPSTGRPRQRTPQNPFLMPGGPGFSFNWPFQNDPLLDDEPPVTAAPGLSMPTAPDPIVFVRAIADKQSVVVGEQVAVSFYAYYTQSVHPTRRQEAPFRDFLRQTLVKEATQEPTQIANAGGRRYNVQLLDKVAVFPLVAGQLHTGSLRLSFANARGRPLGERVTDDLVIRVTEPPPAGRPVGYNPGDVGQFSLVPTVAPRRIEQGGTIGVTIKLSGTGNLPQSLRLPERTGIEWLDPEKKESIEPQGGAIAGWRTFGYVVRVAQSGSVDLGEVTLPYWDPVSKSYQVARAALGSIEVTPARPGATPAATAAPQGEPKADPFATLASPRAVLSPWSPPAHRWSDGRALWPMIAAPPFAVLALSGSAAALRRLRARRSARADSPAVLAEKALREAHDAEAKGDTRALASALDRAVHLALEAATGLKSRGVLLADLPGELARRGVKGDLGEAAASVLADCDAIRFEPLHDVTRARDLTSRARRLVADFARHEAA
jgi:hypothetical protein